MFHLTQPTRLSRVHVVYDNITQFKKANLFFMLQKAGLENLANSFSCMVFYLNQDFGIDRIVDLMDCQCLLIQKRARIHELGLFV